MQVQPLQQLGNNIDTNQENFDNYFAEQTAADRGTYPQNIERGFDRLEPFAEKQAKTMIYPIQMDQSFLHVSEEKTPLLLSDKNHSAILFFPRNKAHYPQYHRWISSTHR